MQKPFQITAEMEAELEAEIVKENPVNQLKRLAGLNKPMPEQQDILTTRQATHGNFEDNARVSQAIKRILRGEVGWDSLTDVEREAMDMIALKFSRILSGKSLELQHWEDVVGYAKLAEKQCQ